MEIALNNFYSNKCQLFCTHAWSPGLYALLISRQEEIIGLVKPLLPKPTMKPRVIHSTVISSVSLQITCVYSTNAIIVLFEVSC